MSPQTAPLTFLPSHLKLMVALRPLPEATVTGRQGDRDLVAPERHVRLARLQLADDAVDRDTFRSYWPMVTIFLIVPLFLTFRFLSSRVTWSTKPRHDTLDQVAGEGGRHPDPHRCLRHALEPRVVDDQLVEPGPERRRAPLLEGLRSRPAAASGASRSFRPQAAEAPREPGDGGERRRRRSGRASSLLLSLGPGMPRPPRRLAPRLTPARRRSRRRPGRRRLHEVAG